MRAVSMNENEQGKLRMSTTVSDAAQANSALPQTAGAWLRAARQQRGLHIAALAATLKVPQTKLEALEADRYQDLPDATFARALAKAMCRVLKVDCAPVMGLLPAAGGRALDVSRGLNQPYREWGGRHERSASIWLRRPMVWGAVLLLLAAAAVYLVPASWLTTALPATAAEPVAVPAPNALDSAASAVTLAEPVASFAAVAPSTNEPSMAVPSAAASTAFSLTAGLVPVKVALTSESWVEIVDARGQVLVSRLLRPGEAPEMAGQPPLKIKVGNVAGTVLTVRGSRVDLSPQAIDNVARLELN